MGKVLQETSFGRSHSAGRGGFSLVELLIVVALLSIIAGLAIPAYRGFVQKARETSAISFLQNINKAEVMFITDSGNSSYSADFDELEATGAIPPSTGSASRVNEDYRFDIEAGADSNGNPTWNVTATPLVSPSAARWFYIDQTGMIRYEVGVAAGSGSPAL
jgi:prepilin-type N-terminal cleavage/methylation domain-containing protein